MSWNSRSGTGGVTRLGRKKAKRRGFGRERGDMAGRLSRGEVRLYRFAPPDRPRPVLILTRESAGGHLSTVTVAPITSTIRGVPSEVILDASDGMKGPCAVNLHGAVTVFAGSAWAARCQPRYGADGRGLGGFAIFAGMLADYCVAEGLQSDAIYWPSSEAERKLGCRLKARPTRKDCSTTLLGGFRARRRGLAGAPRWSAGS